MELDRCGYLRDRYGYLPAAQLCTTCQMLLDDILKQKRDNIEDATTDTVSLDCQIILRDLSSCFICWTLADHHATCLKVDVWAADRYYKKVARDKLSFWLSSCLPCDLKLHIQYEDDLDDVRCVSFHVLQGYRPQPQVDDRVEAELALERSQETQIRHWLRECARHQACSRPTTHSTAHDAASTCVDPDAKGMKKFRPTRLVQVGRDESNARLVLTSTSRNYVYATLSHCWGTQPFETLKRHNYEDFLVHIEPSILTKTFAEAIALCRLLDIAYIWIDSLCIIPKDLEDFRTEVSMMDQIYANAFVNIAATVSKDGTEGLFRTINRAASGFISFDPGKTVVVQDSDLLLQSYNDSPLFKRGWIVQEMALSPRTIHFTDTSIYWRCREVSDNWPGWVVPNPMYDPKEKLDLQCLDSVWQVDMAWLEIANRFSATSVTKAEDHVLALTPLAQHFARRYTALGCVTTYVGGCWTHSMFHFLSWISSHSENRRKSIVKVPSWSWLSDRGSVWFSFRDIRSQEDEDNTHSATLLDMEIIPNVPSEPGGLLKYGHLLIKAMWCQTHTSGPLDQESSLKVRRRVQNRDYVHTRKISARWDSAWLDENKSPTKRQFTLLMLVYQNELWAGALTGLICSRVHDSGGATSETDPTEKFTRCGSFMIHRSHNSEEDPVLCFLPAKKFWLV